MSKTDKKPDPKGMSFEEALAELEEIVGKLEGGETDLDGSIAAYERGVALKKHCSAKLKEAELRVEKIELGAGGKVEGTQPFETE
ncbi:MAG: exodeoxyribonuclease VII small subunit [Alphaproteobacteria bacterium]|jgi:exodeoxyribonuclease VII small subunit|nr:exodeoxyribonuclease VII small subunit [Alphaproteobacteria bacterium]